MKVSVSFVTSYIFCEQLCSTMKIYKKKNVHKEYKCDKQTLVWSIYNNSKFEFIKQTKDFSSVRKT